ncbi:Protein boule-like like protein [Argiope bruennichi]|uniref:Protein boule-like like protein n=1 Tax=Argiope bruennichi TaxID=94029 RepID=A0A8T0E0W6_ARGBR|nr:Protein boule-like like protein [Argiope bruennichi]
MQEGSTIPNRVFVGGIPACVNEGDLRSRFVNYGNVKAVKIIRDHMGISKGYGFVTFNTEDEAKRALEKNYRSETSEIFWNSPDSSIVEQETTRKNYMIYSEISDYPGISRYEIPANTYESPNAYIQGGLNFSVTDLQYAYGSPQMNILPYPTLVYLPQQAFHCPGTVSYPINSAFPEIIPILPTPLCCMNESR